MTVFFSKLVFSLTIPTKYRFTQIDSSTISGKLEFVHLYSDVTSVSSVFKSDKIIKKSDNFRIKYLSYSKSVIFLFFLFILGKHVN